MALKGIPNWVLGVPQLGLGKGDLGSSSFRKSFGFGFTLSCRTDIETSHKWECCGHVGGGLSVHRALTAIEEEEIHSSTSNICREETVITSRELQKNLTIFPKPLSVTNLSASGDGSEVRIAYKGIPGSFSEVAALKAYPQCETVPCDDFEAAFKAVELWMVNMAILPIESSIGGSVHRNYDLLLHHRLHIVGEVQMVVNHCLLGRPGVRKEELKCVLSNSQALAQCEISLNKLGIVKEGVDCSASAAQFVASYYRKDIGAVASSRAAEIYGLNILAEKIQDDPDNVTRFLILARQPVIPRTDGPYKTSIVFSLEEGAGVLFKALSVFYMRNIILTKIESRPKRKRPFRVVDDSKNGSAKYFNYLFYVDFEASMAEPRAQNALAHLQEYSTFLKVLGCYPIGTLIKESPSRISMVT